MNSLRLIFRSLAHYPWSGIATAAGIAIATAVIIGAFVVGDSLTRSLEKIVDYRLGQTTHTLTAGERLITGNLSRELNKQTEIKTAPVLKSEAILTVQGTELRLNNIQVWGVDSIFASFAGSDIFKVIKPGEILISDNTAARLGLQVGDELMLRMRSIGPIPPNTPFVSDEGQTVARRVRISGIVGRMDGGHFNTETAQTTPFNVFVDYGWLNRVMKLKDRSNLLIMNVGFRENDLQEKIRKSILAQDLGLELLQNDKQWLLRSERVFIDSILSTGISSVFPDAQPTLSYFANSIRFGDKSTPYSFVNATNRFPQLKAGNIIINRWMADDLQVSVGDSLEMEYFEVGLMRDLQVRKSRFKVQQVISMDDAVRDKELIPHLPGLTDAGSCRDWNAGIPIDLESIRTKDEDYWRDYKGTPKAWITLQEGQQRWENRFGNLTSLEIKTTATRDEISSQLATVIDPFSLEYQLRPVREAGIAAARGGVDFGQLFAGMGMFIIAAGLLLTVLMLQFSLLQRQKQWQLFSSVGFGKKLISRIVFGEAIILVIISTVVGALLSVGYSKAVFWGLNQLWYDMVRTEVLTLHFDPVLIVGGMIISGIAAMGVVFFSLKKSIRLHSNPQFKAEEKKRQFRNNKPVQIMLLASIVITIITLGLSIIVGGIFQWFIAGISLLINLLILAYKFFYFPAEKPAEILSGKKLSMLNLQRNPVRSFTITALLSGAMFLILVLAANRRDMSIDPHDMTGGTGGFSYVAETTIPILRDLNNPEVKTEFYLPEDANIVSFLSVYDDNASCHNLNRVANPRIIATHTAQLEGRFRFVAKHTFLNEAQPWTALSNNIEAGIIPAVADQTVMQWGLGKQVGDTLFYSNSSGETIKLLLVGALNNTVLQGNVIVDIRHFNQHFPAADGASLFLIGTENKKPLSAEEFTLAFRDYGWTMEKSNERLAAFNSVENTYLSVFFLLGALGILLGTIGFAVMMAKTMLERRRETLLYNMLGYKKKLIFSLYFREYITLFAGGMMVGIIPALVASIPVFLAGFHNVSPWFLLITLTALLANGIGWIYLIVKLFLKKNSRSTIL
jgi:putative ABC transport system permease protein